MKTAIRMALDDTATPSPHTNPKPENIPKWMRLVLWLAGAYNLLWGAWAILFPEAVFRWAGGPAPNYPQIWQCVGMIVGVYGVGYLFAARDPFRHWPIILVGLLGKILGPVGMGWSVLHRTLPAAMAWVCVPNDLVWWLPFGFILGRAAANELKVDRP